MLLYIVFNIGMITPTRCSLELFFYSFNEDVLKERCFHLLPYNTKYLTETLDPGPLVPIPPKANKVQGRHDMRGEDKRHMPCHIKATKSLKPIRKKSLHKILPSIKNVTEDQNEEKVQLESTEKGGESKKTVTIKEEVKSSVFLTDLTRLEMFIDIYENL